MLTNLKPAFFILLSLVLISGCGDGRKAVSPVSGTVTLDGEPAADIELTFTPKQIEGGTANVGPYSMGLTDAQGKYSLTSRYGDPGAVVGDHHVSFNFAGADPEEAISEARMAMQEAKGDDSKVAELKATIAKLKNAKVMPNRYSGSDSEIFGAVSKGENTLDFTLTTTKKNGGAGEGE